MTASSIRARSLAGALALLPFTIGVIPHPAPRAGEPADSHLSKGEYSYTVASAPTLVQVAQPQTLAPTTISPSPSAGARFVRLWEYVGLLVVLGVIVFVHGVLPPLASRGVQTADASQAARGLGQIAAVFYLLAAAFRLALQAGTIRVAEAAPLRGIAEIVARTSWGQSWLIGAIGALLVIVGFWLRMHKLAAGSPTALTGALAMTLSPALSGHAAAAKWFIPSVTLDALHVASIGAWLGTLAVLVIIGIPAMARVKDRNADAAVSALVNSFHPIALLGAPLAVFAGVGSSALRLGSISVLTSSRYGEVLIIKLVAVLLVVSFGAWNSMRSRRRLGTPHATASLRRTALTEVVLAALVLWVTTDLVATPVPTELHAP